MYLHGGALEMKVTIVYDDVKKPGSPLRSDHGFSCYIETEDEVVLFDTGTNGDILLHNLAILKKDVKKIAKIVISHEHYDHNGGLSLLCSHIKNARIYRLQMDASNDSSKTHYIIDPVQIADSIYSTGRLKGNPVDELSLILMGSKRNVVLTGCSHPGVESILHAAKMYGDITGIIGGFHGFKEFSILKQMDAVYPCHCTRYKQQIKTLYPQSCHECYVGLTIEI